MKFVPVAPEQFPEFREARRGRVSYPLLKSFLETGHPIAMLDRTGMQQGLQTLMSCLGSYIRNHGLPVKMVTRKNQIYLIRTDLDAQGKPQPFSGNIEQYKGTNGQQVLEASESSDEPAVAITPEEVARRFEEEKGKVTK